MARFDGKVVAVTGAGSGLGEEIAKRLASEGARVAVLDINGDEAARVARAIGGHPYQADVANAEQMMGVMAQVATELGGLHGAVNNAGVGGPAAPTADYPLEHWNRIIAVNLSGVFHSVRAEIPYLLASGGGSIVNMASILGTVAFPGAPAYVAAKHGVIGLTKATALEYGRQGVRVNAVCPTFVKTPLAVREMSEDVWTHLDERHALGRCATEAEVAAMTAFLLSDEASGNTGGAYLVDGGITAA